jgi:hypothetical protein
MGHPFRRVDECGFRAKLPSRQLKILLSSALHCPAISQENQGHSECKDGAAEIPGLKRNTLLARMIKLGIHKL